MVMNIRQKRELAGLSQAALAGQMGVARSAVANWETEVALPRVRQLPDLARALNCSIDELFVPPEQVVLEACVP